jgi:hypothetical protein
MGKIVWLASYPKSGNTWTRAFVLNLFANARTPLPLNSIPKVSPSDVQVDWYHLVDPGHRGPWTHAEIARLRAKVHRKISEYTPDTIFVKTHSPLGPWEGVPLFNMEVTAGAIYIVRNPLDVVASFAHHSGMSCDEIIEVMATQNHLALGSDARVPHPLGSWSQNVASWTARPHPAIHVMRYEDMVADPMTAFGGMMRFLGLPEDRDRLARAVRFTSFDELQRQESEEAFVERGERADSFFRKGRVGGWRNELSHKQAAAVVRVHRVQMQRFGYVPDGY